LELLWRPICSVQQIPGRWACLTRNASLTKKGPAGTEYKNGICSEVTTAWAVEFRITFGFLFVIIAETTVAGSITAYDSTGNSRLTGKKIGQGSE